MIAHEDVRVLIAEDDYLVSQTIQGLLMDVGYTVAGEAVNGFEALNMTQHLQPDVVLMDIKMPDMGGIEAARRIQERCPTPVVILTAYETPDLIEQASQAGVGAYLFKPPQAREIEKGITISLARFNDMMELRRLNEDLEARNAELDTYAYTVAHDLQNPLSLVVGYSEALLKYRDTMSEQEFQECLDTLMRTGKDMSRTVDQLLLLAKARTQEVTLEPLNMAAIVAEAKRSLKYMIDQCQARLVLPGQWPDALGYAPWVTQVWINYISNAIKYGSKPPRVELGATPSPDGDVCFWVRDDGPGIKPEDCARLFTPFTQLHQTRGKGYGLGLSIVQRIVERLGGEVGVESRVGEGAKFTFTLPAHPRKDRQAE